MLNSCPSIRGNLKIARNPYSKILLINCAKRLGIDKKHIAFRDADFVKLLSAHNLKISRLKRRAMTWEAAIEMRRTILTTVTAGKTLTRRNISEHFKNVNWLLWPTARQVSKRIIVLVKSGKNVMDPATRLPKDVKAFWSWRTIDQQLISTVRTQNRGPCSRPPIFF